MDYDYCPLPRIACQPQTDYLFTMPPDATPLPVKFHKAEVVKLRAEAAKKGLPLAAYIRRKLGFPVLKRGRPPAAKNKPRRPKP